MIYVGMDVHRDTVQVAARERDGMLVLEEKVGREWKDIEGICARMPKRARYVMESSSVSHGLYRFMSVELGLDVVMSNPYQTKAIAASKKKTDKVDAAVLSDLLRGGYISPCYVPDIGDAENRQLVRYRHKLVGQRTSLKNSIHAILLQEGNRIPGTPFSSGYVDALRRKGDYRIDGYLKAIGTSDWLIAKADASVRKAAAASRYASLLMTIPGVGAYTALVMASEIGDISRFADSSRLVSYAGLAPSVRNSADTVRHGRITKRGSGLLRHVLVEAVHSHARHAPDSNVSAFYRKIAVKRRKGRSKAAVAAAAKLLRVAYWMLLEGREYAPAYGQCQRRGEVPEG